MSNSIYSGVDLPQLSQTVAGLQSGSTASVRLQKLAAVPLSAGVCVRVSDVGSHVDRASATNSAHALSPLGITVAAVGVADAAIEVIAFGELVNDSWSWTPDQGVYLGPNGTLVQTRDPSWPFSRVVGFAVTPTRLFVSVQLPIYQV